MKDVKDLVPGCKVILDSAQTTPFQYSFCKEELGWLYFSFLDTTFSITISKFKKDFPNREILPLDGSKLLTPKDILTSMSAEVNQDRHCVHKWKEYIGLTQHYSYCTKCDEKKR